MVVIEPASGAEDVESTRKQEGSTAEAEETTTGRETEGFETASDGEADDDDDGDGGGDGEHAVSGKDDSYEDALTDDQLKERQLTQANDAKAEGNELFRAGKYEDALAKYELAIQIIPEMPASVEVRSICHANRAACFSKLGKHEETIKECTKALELNPAYMKALIRRAETHEKLEHFDEAIADMKKILELDPSHDLARRSIRRLEPLAAEKREKMKEEMIAKLKEMGNSILGRFGMSVDNFKAVKDPNTGSYSVSFQR